MMKRYFTQLPLTRDADMIFRMISRVNGKGKQDGQQIEIKNNSKDDQSGHCFKAIVFHLFFANETTYPPEYNLIFVDQKHPRG
jgi:hypothetical protein